MAITTEHWVNHDDPDGTYAIDIQIQGWNPKRHGDEATLRRFLREARAALVTAREYAADNEESDG